MTQESTTVVLGGDGPAGTGSVPLDHDARGVAAVLGHEDGLAAVAAVMSWREQ
ncbi:hypothetical protein [Streptomyces sp. NPDC014995]|uniref:hypothetical protein n=1 Tax=Streptomyces sp. NPDC014995 TaxID=3364936 RepID=UPI0036F6DD17